jgi:hypothetical protein
MTNPVVGQSENMRKRLQDHRVAMGVPEQKQIRKTILGQGKIKIAQQRLDQRAVLDTQGLASQCLARPRYALVLRSRCGALRFELFQVYHRPHSTPTYLKRECSLVSARITFFAKVAS